MDFNAGIVTFGKGATGSCIGYGIASTLYGPTDPFRRRGVFSFNLDGVHSHDVAQYLDKTGVAVRSGHHCAQPAMRLLGIPSTARASLAAYNTMADIDKLVDGILGVQEYFK